MESVKNEIESRIITAAQILGSTAETVKAAHRYIMRRQRHPLAAKPTAIDPIREPLRKISEYKLAKSEKRIEKHRSVIMLGQCTLSDLRNFAWTKYPRRQNWDAPHALVSESPYDVRAIDNGKYSSRCTFTHWTYRPVVGCYGIVRGKLGLEFHFAGKVSMLAAPHGYRWDRDNNGIRLVAKSNPEKDYHPTADDLRDYSKKAIVAKINDLHKQRCEAKRKQREDLIAVRKAEKEGVMVCLRDSLKAGNCEVGTRNFASRHGLDPQRHYRPTELLKIANGDAHRVRLAVAVGLRRHRHEMTQGFSLIEDHR